MPLWQIVTLALLGSLVAAAAIFALWLRHAGLTPAKGAVLLKTLGVDLILLPGRLRRLAADPRTPRQAKWALLALALYVASPIDPIPDFIPLIGHLDEIILVPLALARIRRLIPPAVWTDHFPPKPDH